MAILRANAELVTVAWLAGVNGINAAMVGTTVPTDNKTWQTSGFVQVATAGGSANRDVPMRNPVMRLHSWAFNPNSMKPAWGKAANLLELIYDGTHNNAGIRHVDLPGGYPSVRVTSAYFVSDEPQRAPDDGANYAHYFADLAIHWVEVPA